MALLLTVYELAEAIIASADGAQTNKSRCGLLARRAERLTSTLKRAATSPRWVDGHIQGIIHLRDALQDARELCEKYSKKWLVRRLLCHDSDSDDFDEVQSRLGIAVADLQLEIAFNSERWREAREQDNIAMMSMMADLMHCQQDMRRDLQTVIELLSAKRSESNKEDDQVDRTTDCAVLPPHGGDGVWHVPPSPQQQNYIHGGNPADICLTVSGSPPPPPPRFSKSSFQHNMIGPVTPRCLDLDLAVQASTAGTVDMDCCRTDIETDQIQHMYKQLDPTRCRWTSFDIDASFDDGARLHTPQRQQFVQKVRRDSEERVNELHMIEERASKLKIIHESFICRYQRAVSLKMERRHEQKHQNQADNEHLKVVGRSSGIRRESTLGSPSSKRHARDWGRLDKF